ncbi:hypothetical protein F4779DRAFT_635194 [Xylariaceae sp. FL0662B]|nr:hypothetical protein F4779DRAFT_635194 [Xylariaceae sp. FL0662B]
MGKNKARRKQRKQQSLLSVLPRLGFWFRPGRLLEPANYNGIMVHSLTQNLEGRVTWEAVDERLHELFTICCESTHVLKRGWESFWLHVYFAVSWTKDDKTMNQDILQQFVEELAEARARGRKPANYEVSMQFGGNYGTVVDPLDEWIDFLIDYYPDDAPSDEPLEYATNVDPVKEEEEALEAEEKAAEGHDDDKDDDEAGALALGNEDDISGAIGDIDQEAQHRDKKIRFTTERMEDLELEDVDWYKRAMEALAKLQRDAGMSPEPENIVQPTSNPKPREGAKVEQAKRKEPAGDQEAPKEEKKPEKPAAPPRRFKPKAPKKRYFERVNQ